MNGADRKPRRTFLVGIPDDRLMRVEILASGNGTRGVAPGTPAFVDDMSSHFTADPVLYCSAERPVVNGLKVARLPMVNYMAEADRYRGALLKAEEIVRRSGLPCFNHPTAIRATTRDQVSARLQGIAGLVVPRTFRFKPAEPRHFPMAVGQAGLQYPVLARLAGTQSGRTLLRIEAENQWPKVHGIPWGGSEVYLTQFHDFADADGRYRKLRLAVVGEHILVRHRMAGAEWMMHSRSRIESYLDEEQAFLDDFERATLPVLRPAVRAMAERLQLDYFGIDASLRPDGSLLLFEANASMSLLRDTAPKPNIFEARIRAISQALLALLDRPEVWRHRRTADTAAVSM